ncbi:MULTISPECIES: glycosyltransferase family 4 protein [unclassified Pseudomonas]|uniref:glycosyltransferase family 4 protein n=1 Tax=unclassified Pseudomonas TaxID=196821 RepID=UPI0021C7BAFE|nr:MULTISPECIES: glycosyltransferase family 1 protein [unclassified Pseudomonas]MCU1721119.1 glycosyltransferase family 1 protein [Pseudomonas sp. 5P_5.1_Bac1]MCU1732027.1 glycosyltransferase family 1 protein [Pseudomonas sp. 20P_3.2_Bac4]MCU1745893.1 glycosyltransferase family 1 protein [Pseudomonas sp. 20P_3.2_Bac5]
MLIVHIADITMFYAPASGGVRTYLDAKHRRLGLTPNVRHSLLIPGATACQHNGIHEVPAPPLPFGNGYRFPLRLAPWCNVLHELQPDLIEVGDPYLTAWAALGARRRLDVPVIGFYHSDLPLLVSNRMGNWFTPNVEAYVSKLYGNFDRVLAPSQVMASKLRRLGIDNVHVQRLGVDLATFHPDHRDPGLRAELGLPDDTRLLVFAGRGSREKNLPVLLDCIQRLGKPYHLLLVGSHMPAHVPDNVTVFDHFRPASEVARLLASADLLVHAGDQETFGLVILEAMASAIPVVAVAAGAFREIVDPGCGQLCAPGDGQAMAAAVAQVFERNVTLLGQRARLHVEQHYSWDSVVSGLLEHYRAVLGYSNLPVRAHA